MNNTITLTIPFSYKGVDHAPSALIDLDTFVKNDQDMGLAFHLVAKENHIDPYSYEYEVLESSTLEFSEPTGIAGEFLTDTTFDFESFKEKLDKLSFNNKLAVIAKDVLNIDNLENHNDIKTALLKAYDLGKQSK